MELIALAETRGVAISQAQLERWRAAKALPSHRRIFLGRGKGSRSVLDPEVADFAVCLARHSARGRPVEEVTLRVLLYEPKVGVHPDGVRAALAWYVKNRLAGAHYAALAVGGSTDDEREDRAAEAVADHYRRLPPQVRKQLLSWVPGVEQLALASALGLEGVGADLLEEAVAIGSPDDPISRALAEGVRNAEARELRPARGIGRQELLDAAENSSPETLIRVRNDYLELASIVGLLHLAHRLLPGEPVSQLMDEVLQEKGFLALILHIYAPHPETGISLHWPSDVKMILQSIASPTFHHSICGIASGLSGLLGREDRLVDAIAKRLSDLEPRDLDPTS